jgi:hydrophobe/amphiphile efflux-3 (HAE3) family protein
MSECVDKMGMYERFARLVTEWPKVVLLLAVLATVLAGSGLTELTIRTNQDADLPEDDPIIATKNRIDAIFGDRKGVMIGLQAETIYTTETLEKVAAITRELQMVDHVVVDQVESLTTVNNISAYDWGLEVGPFIRNVPETKEDLASLREAVESNSMANGRLVSEAGDFTVISAQVEEGYDQGTLYNQVYAIAERYQGPENIVVTGDPIFTEEIDRGIQTDTSVLIPLALLLIMVGLFVAFRNVRGVLLPMVSVILSIISAMGMMGHMGLPQTAVSSALPLLLVTIASSYGIHILIYYYRESYEEERRVEAALAKVLPSLTLVALTSMLGAATLGIFKILMIKEFAIAATVGIFFAWFINITVLPALLQVLRRFRDRADIKRNAESTPLENALVRLTDFSFRNARYVVMAYVVLALVSIYGVTKIQTGIDFTYLFEEDNQARVAFNIFNDSLSGARMLNVMLSAPSPGMVQSKEYFEYIDNFQKYMEKLDGVGYAYSIVDVVEQIAGALNPDEGSLQNIVTDEELAQYFLLYDMSGEPGDFENLIDYDYQRAKIQIMLTTSDPDRHRALYESANGYLSDHLPPDARADFGGDVMIWLSTVDYIVEGKVLNIILALVLIVLMVGLVNKSLSSGLYAVTPIAASVLVTFAFMGYLGLRLDMPTAIITGIAVGIGVDFSIHYLSRLRSTAREMCVRDAILKTSSTSGKAIFYDTFTNVLGFSMLIMSQFAPVQTFGYLVSFTMLTMGLSVLVLLPAMIGFLRPVFLEEQAYVEERRVSYATS